MVVKQLLILAGGKGKRLGGETMNTPKPLVKIVGDTTMLDLLISRYAIYFSDVVILSGYLSQKITDHVMQNYKDRYPNVRVLIEDEPMGTAGPLLMHKDELDEIFFIMNGDTWLSADPRKLGFRDNSASIAQIAVTSVNDARKYGSVKSDSMGRIVDFAEKDLSEFNKPGFVNAGWYLVKKKIIDHIDSLPCSLEKDIFPKLAGKLSLESVELEGPIFDIGATTTLEYARKQNLDFYRK